MTTIDPAGTPHEGPLPTPRDTSIPDQGTVGVSGHNATLPRLGDVKRKTPGVVPDPEKASSVPAAPEPSPAAPVAPEAPGAPTPEPSAKPAKSVEPSEHDKLFVFPAVDAETGQPKEDDFHWKRVAGNNKIVSTGEGYTRRDDAETGALRANPDREATDVVHVQSDPLAKKAPSARKKA